MTDDEARPAGGQALKTAIHIARERVEIPSDRQLALRAGVSYDTLMNWFAERTIPRPAELGKVAKLLDVRLVELMDVYEGRDPQPPSLEARIAELVDELRVFVHEARLQRAANEESTAAILRALGAMARGGPGPRGTPSGTEPGARAGNRRP
ncbi:MAG TPA: helix-turn-helix transcriptional regulator [Candidatus Limnocylindrales bacterium]|nr:helix-turn-helix transcriptional regulator [Candidatus Limnocylindrales bacterium]